ncbi:MAG: hypothetical protein Q7T94_00945 [Rugosibacter sp.]|nr:hypothetical protein [Rugosibacter sp.]
MEKSLDGIQQHYQASANNRTELTVSVARRIASADFSAVSAMPRGKWLPSDTLASHGAGRLE